MTRLIWNQTGDRLYETGVDHGVLYPRLGPGVPWNGLVSVSENASGGEVESLYFDGVKYLDLVANEDFEATLDALSAPPEFASCDGSKALSPGLFATQQPRSTFGLSYRTLIGNDLDDISHGYKLHIVYNAVTSPASRDYKTTNSSPEPNVRQWTINTVPPPANTHKPTAHFVIDSTLVDPYMLADVESFLYGHDGQDPILLLQSEVIEILANRIIEPLIETI
jgi:hypothetical protein